MRCSEMQMFTYLLWSLCTESNQIQVVVYVLHSVCIVWEQEKKPGQYVFHLTPNWGLLQQLLCMDDVLFIIDDICIK